MCLRACVRACVQDESFDPNVIQVGTQCVSDLLGIALLVGGSWIDVGRKESREGGL